MPKLFRFLFIISLLLLLFTTLYAQEAETELVAFDSDRDGDWEIYTINSDSTNLQQLTDNDALDGDLSWSPDGARIVFNSDRDGNPEIYVMNADGGSQTRLTTNDAADFLPDWSPLGDKIAFVSERDGNPEIYVMNADGTNQLRLTVDGAFDARPHWSPDGTTILFDSDRDGDHELFLLDIASGGLTQLTNNLSADFAEGWSADGSQILFASDRNGNFDVFVMQPDGSQLRQITAGAEDEYIADWSADGEYIAVTTTLGANDWDIYIYDLDGNEIRVLTDFKAMESSPQWRPGSTMLVAATSPVMEAVRGVAQADEDTVLTMPDGASVLLRPGSVPDGNPITMVQLSTTEIGAPALSDAETGAIYDIEAEGWTADLSATITLPVGHSIDPAEAHTYNIAYLQDGEWITLPSSVDVDSGLVSATVDHFSIFTWIRRLFNSAPTVIVTTQPTVILTDSSHMMDLRGELVVDIVVADRENDDIQVEMAYMFRTVASDFTGSAGEFEEQLRHIANVATTDFSVPVTLNPIVVGRWLTTTTSEATLDMGVGQLIDAFPSISTQHYIPFPQGVIPNTVVPNHRYVSVFPLSQLEPDSPINQIKVVVLVTDAVETKSVSVEIPVTTFLMDIPELTSPTPFAVCPPQPDFQFTYDYIYTESYEIRVVQGDDLWGSRPVVNARRSEDDEDFHPGEFRPEHPLREGLYSWGVAASSEANERRFDNPLIVKSELRHFRVDNDLDGSECVMDLPFFEGDTAETTNAITEAVVAESEVCTISTSTTGVVAVRVGPGTNRSTVTYLPAGLDVTVLGVDDSHEWWRVDKDIAAPGKAINEAWVAAADVTTSGDCDAVGVAAAPPLIPIVQQPPVTTSLDTTEEAANPPVEEPPAGGWSWTNPRITFWADDENINRGTCTAIRWDTEFIVSVYLSGGSQFNNEGVIGVDSRNVCPTNTATYTLLVNTRNGQVTREVTIHVEDSATASTGGGGTGGTSGGGGGGGNDYITFYDYYWFPESDSWVRNSTDIRYCSGLLSNSNLMSNVNRNSTININGTLYYDTREFTDFGRVGGVQRQHYGLVGVSEFRANCQ